MKTLLPFAFSVLPFFCFCQNPDSTAVAKQVDSLLQVSRTLTGQQHFDQALELNAIAEKLALEKFNSTSVAYGNACFNHGRVLFFMKKYAEAEKWYLESKVIRENTVGTMHPDYAWTLNGLGNVCVKLGNYEKAEPYFLDAKNIREKTLGLTHPDYAASLNNLAAMYTETGNYEKAEPLLLESKNIREKVFGKAHPEYASSLNNLGFLFTKTGNYEKAEPLLIEAKNIREKILGKEHPEYAKILSNLAIFYAEMGNYEKAGELLIEAHALREKTLGKEHPEYVNSQSNLALFYSETGNYEKAESLLIQVKLYYENKVGKEHPDYGSCLNNLGNIYLKRRDFRQAELLLMEAKTIRENALGKEHPDYISTLNNLAILYSEMGNYEKAEQLHQEVKTIRERKWGMGNPVYGQSVYSLGITYWASGNFPAAEANMREAISSEKALIVKGSKHLSESEMLAYINKFSSHLDRSFSLTQITASPALFMDSYDNAIFYKGFLLYAHHQVRNSIAENSASAGYFQQLKSYQRRLSQAYAKPIAERQNVAELEAKANQLEKELVRTVAGYGESLRQVTWQEVQAQLQPGEAAIEFVHYRFHRPNAMDSMMYAALVLRPGDDSPHWVTLFEERQLTALLGDLSVGKAEFVNRLYASPALYRLIWKPLEKWLDGAERIYYAPSGLLHRLCFEAIPLENGAGILADRHALHRMVSTRQLATEQPASPLSAGDAAVVFGGVRYEMDSAAVAAANREWADETLPAPDSETHFRSGNGSAWAYLQWTEIEAKSVAELLEAAGAQVSVRQGFAATEESFAALGKNLPAPKVLHLATHAFFFPDPTPQPPKGGAGAGSGGNSPSGAGVSGGNSPSGVGGGVGGERGGEPVFKMSDHPMMRSGLALAGANRTWLGGKPLQGMEDGILTAYEISQADLGGTELAVLSACETGLGDLAGNEGVFGLQRAFKIAGVQYLVMSLWQVPDFQTEELMTAFYAAWLEGGKSIPEAFRSAQAQVRAAHPEPFKWAGFVLVE